MAAVLASFLGQCSMYVLLDVGSKGPLLPVAAAAISSSGEKTALRRVPKDQPLVFL